MDPTRWMLRAKRLAQNPPSWGKVKLVIGIIIACLALLALERIYGAPDWMKIERGTGMRIQK